MIQSARGGQAIDLFFNLESDQSLGHASSSGNSNIMHSGGPMCPPGILVSISTRFVFIVRLGIALKWIRRIWIDPQKASGWC